MTTFDKRKDGFESKFAQDEALRFRATSRRNKLLGLWAAERLGKSGADAEEYARQVMRADLEEAGDDDVLRKVRSDLEAAGITESEEQVRATMNQLLARAVSEVEKDG